MKRPIAAGLAIMIAGAVILLIENALDPARAAFSYVAAFAFSLGVALGALLLIQIVDTAHADWVIPLRRLVEAVAGTLPLHVVLFLPVALRYRTLYPWARPSSFSEPEVRAQIAHVGAWFAPSFFFARAALYLLVWSAVALVLRHASTAQDRTRAAALTDRQRSVGSATIPLVAITLTLAAFDWFMSLVPGWASDLYGVYFFAGGFFGAVALLAVQTWAALRAGVLPAGVGPSHVSAVGRLLLTGVILWSYIAAASLILIWIANLPREVRFYSERVAGGWAYVTWALVLGHFLVPFLLLLLRSLKRRAASLALVGAWALLMHALDVYWLVVPSSARSPHILDLGAFLAVIGATASFGAWQFAREEPYPSGDPGLGRALRYESE